MFRKSVTLLPVMGACRSQVPHSRSIWGWRPTGVRSLIRDMERDISDMERSLFRASPLRLLAPRFVPIDGQEMKNDSYRVNIDVQGFKPENIKIALNDNVLKIEANMDETSGEGGRIQQTLMRQFTLPENIDPESLKSLLHADGILSIEAELAKAPQPKEIPIESDTKAIPKSKM